VDGEIKAGKVGGAWSVALKSENRREKKNQYHLHKTWSVLYEKIHGGVCLLFGAQLFFLFYAQDGDGDL
jgi:hypothetical protein